jgi:tetratricopeptide (TPR) repeat protein
MNFVAKILLILFLTFPAFSQIAQTEQARIDAGNRYIADGHPDKAIIEYDTVIRFNPRSNIAFGMRGYARMLKGDAEGAVADYTTAIKLAPNIPGIEKAYNNRGMAYQFKGDSINAYNDFDRAIIINPKYASPYNGRGVILERRGKLLLALADFNTAIELNPDLTPAYGGRAGVRFQRSEFDLALADYNKALQLDPSAPSMRLNRGIVQGMRNRWEMAVDDIKTAFELQRGAHPTLGGSLSPAFFDLDKYIAANPKKARAYAARGLVNLLRNKDDEAEKDFKKGATLEPALNKMLSEFITYIKETR